MDDEEILKEWRKCFNDVAKLADSEYDQAERAAMRLWKLAQEEERKKHASPKCIICGTRKNVAGYTRFPKCCKGYGKNCKY